MRQSITFLALVFLTIAVAHGKGKPPEYFVDETKLPFDALPGAQALFGVHAGAGYRIEVPDNWNGKLVVWAHGFRGTGLELTVDNHPLRTLLIPQGYAWAASSYDRNDYDITSGVKSTHALIKHFNGLVGKPEQIIMSGASMGGHITGVIIEQYPNLFAGALPICGVMADYELFDYFLDFNLAAQQMGVGFSTYPIEAGTYLFGTVPAIKGKL
jgi:poly(3-hydroxybutyrate) depolymerase